tara:strand:- start:354 stop:512 length:159 start_codon:yes stop_codon:yes gene_type:complete
MVRDQKPIVKVPELVKKERAPSVEQENAPIPEVKRSNGCKPMIEKSEVEESL